MSQNHSYLNAMSVRLAVVAGLGLALVSASAAAQIVPTPPALENRIPAPLPPPPQPPIINGPLGQSPPPGVYVPPGLNTFSDRVTGCLHQGRADGLRGKRLQSYAQACANAN
jgi:DNA-binding transcriptional LysR family regulator